MRLVIALAGRFRHYGLSPADLVQEGHIGLLEAAQRFEPERDVRFSTYATWWIRASIQDYVLRNWSIVRGGTSSTQKALFFNLRRLRARLARGEEAQNPNAAFQSIADALGVPRADVELMNSRLGGATFAQRHGAGRRLWRHSRENGFSDRRSTRCPMSWWRNR